MARTRQIYADTALFVGPTGQNSATGKHYSLSPFKNNPPSTAEMFSGDNFIAELYRIQRVSWNAQKNLTDVNQLGELAAIDRVPLSPPTVSMSVEWIQANVINESLMGLTVTAAGGVQISCISGLLAGNTSPKNYFLKTVAEGQDVADNAPTNYNVIALGNGFISSYTAQGAVGGFPTVSVALDGLNIQADSITAATGVLIPAINPSDASLITGYYYKLPSGLTSYNDAGLSNNFGISALRPGDITLSLGLNAQGDTFFDPNDLKIQSYNISFNLNQQDLQKLGSKYAFAKVPQFPVVASMQVQAIVGEFVTGKLTEIVNNNFSFNPTVTITKPGDTTTTVVKYTLANAKLDTQSSDINVGANKTLDLTFNTQIGGPSDTTKGVYIQGVTVNAAT